MKSTQRGWIAKRSITVGDAVNSRISDGGGADGIQHATSGTAYNLPRTTSGVQRLAYNQWTVGLIPPRSDGVARA